jgi:predicted nucleotidyltransferase/predicted transcriptional regulator
MINRTELEILMGFFPIGKEITLKRIMEKSGLSYEPVYRTIKELSKQNIISGKKFGKTAVYSLDFKKEEVKTAFFFYAKNRLRGFSKNNKVVYNALMQIDDENIDFLAVFGSYAKGNQTKESDVDVLCVSSNKKVDENEIGSLRHKTNLEFSPVVIPKSEFKKIKKENDVFWQDLIEYCVIFKGYELLYSEAYLK